MTVDLSKAKAGQIAHFRCGGSAQIDKIERNNVWVQDWPYRFEDGGKYYYLNTMKESFIDIIRLDDPPFDWKDVKPGMAFRPAGEHFFGYFIAFDRTGSAVLDIYHVEGQGAYNGWETDYLTRTPEHDIEVKS